MSKNQIRPKTRQEIRIMAEGGKKLGAIKTKLMDKIKQGTSAAEMENLAVKLIEKAGGKPSFKMVPGYSWATCVNVNDGIVHGVPHKKLIFKKGDVVSVDVGFYWRGFHTDTSFSVGIDVDPQVDKFLAVGKRALTKAAERAKVGNRVFDISKTIQEIVEEKGYKPIETLVGHGIGRELHEGPQVSCFVKGIREDSPEIPEGTTLAIEVMYTQGSPKVVLGDDGWTISTADGKISALFEETVAVTRHGPLVLTAPRQTWLSSSTRPDAILSKAN